MFFCKIRKVVEVLYPLYPARLQIKPITNPLGKRGFKLKRYEFMSACVFPGNSVCVTVKEPLTDKIRHGMQNSGSRYFECTGLHRMLLHY